MIDTYRYLSSIHIAIESYHGWQVSAEAAKAQVEQALGAKKGSGDVYAAELSHVAALAACAANMRVFDSEGWKKDAFRAVFHGFSWTFVGFPSFFMDFPSFFIVFSSV